MSAVPTITFRAGWVVPIVAPPIRDGFVTVDWDARIRAVSADHGDRGRVIDLGDVALVPALVNAHTHLELSFLCGRVPPSASFNDWVTTLMTLRRSISPDANAPEIVEAARIAIRHARACGTGLIGDVTNTLVAVDALRESRTPARVFYELTGFNLVDVPGRVAQARRAIETVGADRHGVRVSLAPHAPYSVSPALFTAIRRDVDAQAPPDAITSVHLGESAQEVDFLRSGTGPARAMLERLGVWTDAWRPPGVSPVQYLSDLGFLDRRTLVVHGVQFTADDLARIKAIGATLVSCPRSNVYVGAGSPPLESFYESGVDVAFGTDSLASVADLNMFSELAEARRIAPRVPARRLLESATLIGARALGFEQDFGCIDGGKRAALIAVRTPADVSDVEEYLVGGIEPSAIEWLDQTTPNAQLPTSK
jgi:cytosine/adenosine deaminase-related metal-dependent hydrolase